MKLRIIDGFINNEKGFRVFIGALEIAYVYHDIAKGDLFEQIPEHWRISQHNFLDDPTKSWLYSQNIMFEGTREECITQIMRLLNMDSCPQTDEILRIEFHE